MNNNRVLLKLKNRDGSDKLYNENLPNKYHPFTKELVKKGDWQYKVIDKKAWDAIAIDHYKEYELIDTIGWEIYEQPKIEEVQVELVMEDITKKSEVKIITPKSVFNPKDYSVVKFRETEFDIDQLNEFIKIESLPNGRKSILALAKKRIKEI